MEWLDIFFYVLAIISLIVALLLSGNGSTGGLSSVAGNELEIFKKTKDRGLIKILQLVLFILVFVLIGIGIVIRLVVYK